MTIADMVRVLHARVLCGGERIDTPVYTACCSDLMSDVPPRAAHRRYAGS